MFLRKLTLSVLIASTSLHASHVLNFSDKLSTSAVRDAERVATSATVTKKHTQVKCQIH